MRLPIHTIVMSLCAAGLLALPTLAGATHAGDPRTNNLPTRRVVRGRFDRSVHRELGSGVLGKHRLCGTLRRFPRTRYLGARQPERDLPGHVLRRPRRRRRLGHPRPRRGFRSDPSQQRPRPRLRGDECSGGDDRLRGTSDFRRQRPGEPRVHQGRADRLRGAHAHARSRSGQRPRDRLRLRRRQRRLRRADPYGTTCAALHPRIVAVQIPLDDPTSASVVNNNIPAGTNAAVTMSPPIPASTCSSAPAVRPWSSGTSATRPIPYSSTRRRPLRSSGPTSWRSASITWDGKVLAMGWEPGGGCSLAARRPERRSRAASRPTR